MSFLRETFLHELMVDYVQQHRLHLHVGDLGTWERFQKITGMPHSAVFLQQEYQSHCMQLLDHDTRGVSSDLAEGVHYTWCNDIREGLQATGIPVHRDIGMICQQQMNSFSSNDGSVGQFQLSSEAESGSGVSGGTLRLDGSASSCPRSKKRLISNHERFMQIKRNLVKVQKRRRSSTRF